MTVLVPVLITPPGALFTSIDEVKAHLRVSHSYEDTLISQITSAAVAYLDGWKGVLGRCIMPQTWSVEADAGDVLLPFPDITEARVGGVSLPITLCANGAVVTIEEAATIDFDCELPESNREVVKVIVKLLVGHWYENREAVVIGNITTLPIAVDALMAPLRWRVI